MPGTFGTLAAIPLYLLLQPLALGPYLLLTLLFFVLGVWACRLTSEAMGVHDHPSLVWDEVVGYLITMAWAPAGWSWVLLGFVLFRLFDIWKPGPIGRADARGDALGVMLDDIIAGVFAAILVAASAAFVHLFLIP